MEIADLVHEIEEGGVILWFKENNAIGLRGKQSAVAGAIEKIEPYREEVKAYLRRRQEPPIEGETEAVMIGPIHFTHCPKCGAILEAPSIDVQLDNFRLFQRDRGEYWIWNAIQMEGLRQTMKPGDVIEYPPFAMSVRIRRPDGFLYIHERGAPT